MGLALGFGVLTASLLVSLVMVVQQPGPGAPSAAQMAAVLKGPDGHSAILTVHRDRLVLTAVGPVATPSGKAFELWMLPKQGKPQAVGLVQLGSSDTLHLPALALLALASAKGFAISVEPPGGSPTGQPTGPITYVGDVVAMTQLEPGKPHLAPGQGGGDFYE
jgi:anti-sigma-K factor RskA